jgi:hypothetical protein
MGLNNNKYNGHTQINTVVLHQAPHRLFYHSLCLPLLQVNQILKFDSRCKKLREETNDNELINAKKDTTRPSNVYYGLNWGYRSDNTVRLMTS